MPAKPADLSSPTYFLNSANLKNLAFREKLANLTLNRSHVYGKSDIRSLASEYFHVTDKVFIAGCICWCICVRQHLGNPRVLAVDLIKSWAH